MQLVVMELWKRNLLVAWLAQFIGTLGFQFVLPFLPLYVQDLGITNLTEVELWTGVLALASGIPLALSAPIWGTLADRYGRKMMVERSMFAGAFILVAMGLVSDVNQLLILRVLQGMFTGTISASVAMVSTLVPTERMGFSLGLMQMAVFGGATLGPLVGGVMSDFLDFRTCFWATGVMLLVAGTLVVFLIDEGFKPSKSQGKFSLGAIAQGYTSALSSRQLLPLIVVVFALQGSVQVAGPILPLFVQELGEGEYVASMSGAIMAVAGIASAVSAMVAGRLSDRVGHRRVLILATLGAGLTCVPQVFVRDNTELLILRGLMGLFVGGMMPSANALIGVLTPIQRRGSVFGLSSSAGAWGLALGPMLGAVIAAGLGLRSVFFSTAVILVGVSLWVWVAVTPTSAEVVDDLEDVPEDLERVRMLRNELDSAGNSDKVSSLDNDRR